MHLLWTRRQRNVLIICRRQLLTQTTASDKKKDIKKPATHRVIWLFNSLIQRQGSKFDLQATLYKWNLVASLTISLNNVKYLMVKFLTRYDVKDIYLCYSLFLFWIGVGIGCAAQPIPFFGYAIRHAFCVTHVLWMYWVLGFKIEL